MATYQQRKQFRDQLPAGMSPLRRLVALIILDIWIEAVRQGHDLTIRNEILAQMARCSIRTVQRTTAMLVECGMLDKIKRFVKHKSGVMRRLCNRYRLLLSPVQQAWRRLMTIAERLRHDSAVRPRTRIPYSDSFLPSQRSETYRRLMQQGLGKG